MKKALSFVFVCTVSLLFFTACEKQEVLETTSYEEPIIEQIQNQFVTQKISTTFDLLDINYEKIEQLLGLESLKKEDFNFENLFSTKIVEGEAVIAPYKFNTSHLRLALVFVKLPEGFNTPFLVKTTNGEVVYLDLANNNVIHVNKKDSKLQFKAQQLALQSGDFVTLRGKGKCTGQAVADCMNDGYTNHGWTSVGLLVLSAVVWETVVVMAVACTVANC
ncbi:MAG: hypothetical protein ACK4TA_18235 [Saprospiraceae bacterium]